MEEIEQIDVVRFLTEMFLEKVINRALEHEGIVDSDHADTLIAVPARLATTGDTGVHNIIRDQEEGLKLI